MKTTLFSLFSIGLIQSAFCASIAITNYSFSDPVLSDDGFTIVAPPSWSGVSAPGHNLGIYNPLNNSYSGTTGGVIPGTGEGDNLAYLNFFGGQSASLTYTGTIGNFSSYAIGDVFTAKVAIGRGVGSSSSATYFIDLLKDGIAIATTSGSATAGTFIDLTTNYTVAALDTGAIGIRIRSTNTLTNPLDDFQQAHFDNVRLDVIPEVSISSLGCLSALALVMRRRRK